MDWEIIRARLDALLAADKHTQLRGALMMLGAVDIAEYLAALETGQMLKVFRLLPKDISADVFSYMDDARRQKLVESIGDAEVRALVSDMFIDDAVDFLEDMPADLVKRVLAGVDDAQRRLINDFLKYPEGSAGSIMTIEYCAFKAGTRAADAMVELKRTGVDKETIYTLYVTDDKGTLLGALPLRKLILAADDDFVDALMSVNCPTAGTLEDQESVAQTVRKYDLMAVPVIDREQRLVGIVTVDDIMDVVQDETTEDIEKMNALLPSEDAYMRTSVWTLTKNRLPWLVFMMIGAIFTGLIITRYEGLLSGMSAGVALIACIPMLMDTGGNCGAQSSTLTIRGLAVGEITPKDTLRILIKELRVALIVGGTLAAVCFGIQAALFGRELIVALAVSLAVAGTVVLSKTIGCLLPMAAKKLGFDPALTAAPLITTIVDACSLIILFALAGALIA